MNATEFRPTQYDSAIAGFFDPDDPRREWIVAPVSQTRDSGCFDQSNFAVALKILGGESETCEVHRFGHWGPGWYEVILTAPDRAPELQAIADKMEDYPLLDEDDFSNREWEYAVLVWNDCYSLRERVELCQRFDISVFAARHKYLPQDDNGSLFEHLTRA